MRPSFSSLLSSVKAQYIVNKTGKKTGVILDMKQLKTLFDEIEDLYDIAQAERVMAKKGKKYTLKEVEQSLD